VRLQQGNSINTNDRKNATLQTLIKYLKGHYEFRDLHIGNLHLYISQKAIRSHHLLAHYEDEQMSGHRIYDTTRRYVNELKSFLKRTSHLDLYEIMPMLETSVSTLRYHVLKVKREKATFEQREIEDWYNFLHARFLRDIAANQRHAPRNMQYLNVYMLMYIFALRPLEAVSLTKHQFWLEDEYVEIYIPRAKTRSRTQTIQTVRSIRRINHTLDPERILQEILQILPQDQKYILPYGEVLPWPSNKTVIKKLRTFWTIYNKEFLIPVRGIDISEKIKRVTNYTMRNQ
jgi:hypothetical protein